MQCLYKNILALTLSVSILSCSVNPEPLVMGKDACYTCKMTLMDKKFGAEVVTKKGKIYKFDDLNCLLAFIRSGSEPEENIAHLLVIDFSNPENFTAAEQAFYSRSDRVKSPMASHIAAFEKKEDVDRYNKEWEGVILSWQELLRQSR